MLLDNVAVEIERSEVFKESEFGIGNMAVVLSILRSKLYSNPIHTMIQEILCNARDAHREVGKFSTPITIHLPNEVDPYFFIQDYGPGISPDRMENVFLRYGNSTKRTDNNQTGGFGIGAKSPFAYTDSFTIVTNCGDGFVRTYVAYIDESQLGKMAIMSELPDTTGVTGTKISVVVDPSDMSSFESAVCDICQWWEIRPDCNVSIPTIEKEVLSEHVLKCHSNRAIILIDEIPYNFDVSTFKSSKDISSFLSPDDIMCIDDVFNCHSWRSSNRVLTFKTGEISVSANREAIDYSTRNIKAICSAIQECIKFSLHNAQSIIDSCKSYIEAIFITDNAKIDTFGLNLLKKTTTGLQFNGIPIIRKISSDENILLAESRWKDGRIITKAVANIPLKDGHPIVIDDEFKPYNRLRKIKQLIKDKSKIYTIKTTPATPQEWFDTHKEILKVLEVKKLSEIKAEKISKEKVAYNYKVFDKSCGCVKSAEVTYDGPYIYCIIKNNELYFDNDRSANNVIRLSNHLGLLKDKELLCLPPSHVKKFKNAISLEKFVLNKLRKLSNDPKLIDQINCRKCFENFSLNEIRQLASISETIKREFEPIMDNMVNNTQQIIDIENLFELLGISYFNYDYYKTITVDILDRIIKKYPILQLMDSSKIGWMSSESFKNIKEIVKIYTEEKYAVI